MQPVIVSILPIFLVLFFGAALRRFRILDDAFVKTANRLVFLVCLPVLLFRKISASDLRAMVDLFDVGVMAAAILAAFAAGFALSSLARWPKRTAGTLAMNALRGNFAYMGLPVAYYLLGDGGLATASIFMAFLVPYVNSLAVISLNLGAAARFEPLPFLKSTLLNPLFLACALGVGVSLARVPIPTVPGRALDIVAQVTLPLALFCIGAGLRLDLLKGRGWPTWTGALLKLMLVPAVGYLAVAWSGRGWGLGEKVMLVMLASPSALVNYVMADAMDGDADLSSGIIILSTLLSAVGYVFWMSLTS